MDVGTAETVATVTATTVGEWKQLLHTLRTGSITCRGDKAAVVEVGVGSRVCVVLGGGVTRGCGRLVKVSGQM